MRNMHESQFLGKWSKFARPMLSAIRDWLVLLTKFNPTTSNPIYLLF